MKNKQLTGGAFFSYASIAFNIITGLIYTPWMIKTIGSDQYALYSLALSVINLFLLDFGIGSAVQKFLANYYAKGETEKANQFMAVVYKVFLIISAAIAAALFIFYFFIEKVYLKLTADELATFKNLFIIVSAYSVLSFPFTTFNGVLMANERFIEVKACNLAGKMFNVLLIVIMLLTKHGVYSLVLVNALSNFIFYLIKYIIIRKRTKTKAKMRFWDKALAKSLFSFSIWIAVVYIAQRFIFNIMPTIIAALIGSSVVTIFSLSATLEGYVFSFADAINGMFLPKISRIYVKEEEASAHIVELMVKVGRYHIYTIGLIYLGLLCFGKGFVSLWMGEGFEQIYPCALLIIFPSMIDVPQQIGRSSLLVRDKVKGQAVAYIVMAVMNVALSFILIPKLGVIGAALSICIAYLIRTAILNYLYVKYLKLDIRSYFRQAYSRWLISAVLASVFGFGINMLLPDTNWLMLAVKISAFSVVYLLLLFFIAVEKKQKAFIIHKIKGFLK